MLPMVSQLISNSLFLPVGVGCKGQWFVGQEAQGVQVVLLLWEPWLLLLLLELFPLAVAPLLLLLLLCQPVP